MAKKAQKPMAMVVVSNIETAIEEIEVYPSLESNADSQEMPVTFDCLDTEKELIENYLMMIQNNHEYFIRRMAQVREDFNASEAKIIQFMSLGYDRSQAEKMLSVVNGTTKQTTTKQTTTKQTTRTTEKVCDDTAIYNAIITGNKSGLSDSEKTLYSKISCIHRGFLGKGNGGLNVLEGMEDEPIDMVVKYAEEHGQHNQIPLIRRYLRMRDQSPF